MPTSVATAAASLQIIGLLLIGLTTAAPLESAAERAVELRIKLVIFADVSLTRHLKALLRLDGPRRSHFFRAYVAQIEHNLAGLRTKTIAKIRLELVDVLDLNGDQDLDHNAHGDADHKRHQKDGDSQTLHVPPSTGDIDILLDAFCAYQADLRATLAANNSNNPTWHLSLLLTANDLISRDQHHQSLDERTHARPPPGADPTTMGVSLMSGIRWPELGCLLIEFGANYEQPVGTTSHDTPHGGDLELLSPTRAFGSAWVAAHEIGHSLGLHHDGPPFNSDCAPTGTAMSADSPLTGRKFTWSKCSLEALAELSSELTESSLGLVAASLDRQEVALNHLPGQVFDLQEQCRMYARELGSSQQDWLDESMCEQTVRCSVELGGGRRQLVAIGPALEGTYCNANGTKMCIGQQCRWS